jgi:hypothetical protein
VANRVGGIGSVKSRGVGPRVPWSCPACEGQEFVVSVAFIYWEVVFYLATDRPEWPSQEFFNVFLSFACCVGCWHLSEPTDFGKL